MTDRANNALAALLTPPPPKGVQFSQGVILTWDRVAGHNTIKWRGITISDIPFVEGVNPLVLKEGDVVGMLGWAPENAKGVGSWWILGKLTNPGEFVTDLTFNLGQVRWLTSEFGYDQVYFGSDSDDDPLTVFYYGDEDSSRALQISDTNSIAIFDPSGRRIFENDAGTGVGIGRPYIAYPLAPTTNAVINGTVFVPSTTSASYVDLYEGTPSVWHPAVSYSIGISATGVTDWRIVVDGTVVFTGSGSASGTFAIPGWGSAITPGSNVSFVLQARNTGAGFTRMRILRFEGRQS